MSLRQPYLMFLGDAADQLAAKTAIGIHYWRPDWCLGQMTLPGCQADLGLPEMSLAEAADKGVGTLVIGVANRGGVFSPAWVEACKQALELGMDVASGLHERLASVPILAETAAKTGRELFDLRHPKDVTTIATGAPRAGRRMLAVGTDCSVGKMFTMLAVEREMKARGWKADFRATGQTGIFIAGTGISVDAVVSDFLAGSVEDLSPANEPDHWDLIEGQGSLFHPSFAGVSLGLLHGAQAEALVMCHQPGREHMRGLPGRPLPSLEECIALNEQCAALTAPGAKVIAIAANTSAMTEAEAEAYLSETAARLGMPCVDPVRSGVAALVDAVATL
ncbi:MAG: N-acetyltransferase DgcN [Rhodospirillaceae bacterium]